jgi:RNA polymerase sigma-70 factor (ECF subfamily)
MEKTDNELVKEVLCGDKNAFQVLLERHIRPLYQFTYRYLRNSDDADDATQEAFVRAWKNLKKFDTERNFKTWLFTIAKNISLDLIKKKKPTSFSQIGEEEKLDAFLAPYLNGPETPDMAFDRTIMRADLTEALQALPQSYRTVLAMRYEGNLKFREIAEALGEPIDTVKSKHRRGLLMLKKFNGDNLAGSSLA